MALLNPKPGSFGLAVISGKTGRLVRWGQAVVERQDYQYTHAFLVLNNNEVIEAEPGKHGAQINSVDKYLDDSNVIFCDFPVQEAVADACYRLLTMDIKVTKEDVEANELFLRNRIVRFARTLEGTPYGYLDYLSLAAERFNLTFPAVEKRVKRQDRLICSQLVDFVYGKCDIHLFHDGRLPQDVTPGDLEHWVYLQAYGECRE